MTQMTNYNERLDKILAEHREWMRGIRTDRLVGTSSEATKQALTSLIKELVAEAKPAKEIGAPVGKYETGGECSAYADGSNEAAEQFEQNLLKELEEV